MIIVEGIMKKLGTFLGYCLVATLMLTACGTNIKNESDVSAITESKQ